MQQNVNMAIADRIRRLRSARGLSLEGLAQASGVSRSMISLVERGEVSATAVVLDKIATALGVVLVDLFERPERSADPVTRADAQSNWRDPASGYARRNLSAAGIPSPLKLVEVHFPAGARVAYETAERPGRVHQQVWIIEGAMCITVGPTQHNLETGDCLTMVLDQPVIFENRAQDPARYLVAIATEGGAHVR